MMPAAAGALCGVISIRCLVGETSATASTAQIAADTKVSRQATSQSPAPKRDKHDLATIRAQWARDREDGHGVRQEMERMDGSALRDLTVSLAADYGPGARAVLKSALAELIRRDGDAALRWVDSLEPGARREILDPAIEEAARLSPALAKDWMTIHEAAYGLRASGHIIATALSAAISRGADDLIGTSRLFEGRSGGSSLTFERQYPEGFNFAKVYQELPASRAEMLRFWAASDKDAAWSAMTAGLGKDSDRFDGSAAGYLVPTILLRDGEKEGTRWLVEKLDGLPAEDRKSAIGTLGTNISKEGIGALMTALPTDADRLDTARNLLIPMGAHEKGFAALDHVPPASRVELILESAERYPAKSVRMDPASLRAYYDSAAERFGFTQQDRERLAAILEK